MCASARLSHLRVCVCVCVDRRWSCEAHYTALVRPSVCPLYGPHGYVQIGDSDRPLGPDAVRKRFSKPTEEEAAPASLMGVTVLGAKM